MAVLLLQESDGRAGTAARARPFHSADEAQEHASTSDGRRPDHAPGAGVLRVIRRLALLPLLVAVLASCSRNPKLFELRLWSDNYAFRVTVDPTPPRALEPIGYRIVVTDKKTGQPIETVEERMFATSADRAIPSEGL